MAWIESHQELGRHPKTKRLARILGVSLPAAVGHLQFFWWWALDYAQDGDLSRYTNGDIADAALWEGEPERLALALIEAGFVDNEQGGAMRIHDWTDYAGRLIERRRQDADRKRTSRKTPRDVRETSGGRRTDGARNRTVPNPTEQNTAGGGTGEPAAAPSLAAAASVADAPSATEAEAAALRTLMAADHYNLGATETLAMLREQAAVWPSVEQRVEAIKFVAWWDKHDHVHPPKRPNWALRWARWIEKAGRDSAARNGAHQARASPLRIEMATAEDEAWIESERAAGRAAW